MKKIQIILMGVLLLCTTLSAQTGKQSQSNFFDFNEQSKYMVTVNKYTTDNFDEFIKLTSNKLLRKQDCSNLLKNNDWDKSLVNKALCSNNFSVFYLYGVCIDKYKPTKYLDYKKLSVALANDEVEVDSLFLKSKNPNLTYLNFNDTTDRFAFIDFDKEQFISSNSLQNDDGSWGLGEVYTMIVTKLDSKKSTVLKQHFENTTFTVNKYTTTNIEDYLTLTDNKSLLVEDVSMALNNKMWKKEFIDIQSYKNKFDFIKYDIVDSKTGEFVLKNSNLSLMVDFAKSSLSSSDNASVKYLLSDNLATVLNTVNLDTSDIYTVQSNSSAIYLEPLSIGKEQVISAKIISDAEGVNQYAEIYTLTVQ